MRGVTSIAAGIGLLALTFWIVSRDGSVTTALMFGAGTLVLFYHGFKGHGITQAGDVTAPMDFIRNPAGAIVDAAAGKLGEMWTEARASESKEEPAFDPDAVIARHLANRPAPLPGEADPTPAPRTFGRKGLQPPDA